MILIIKTYSIEYVLINFTIFSLAKEFLNLFFERVGRPVTCFCFGRCRPPKAAPQGGLRTGNLRAISKYKIKK